MRLQDRALLVSLAIKSWGTTLKDDEANAAVAKAKNSNPDASKVSKRLAPEDALKLVKARAEDARKYLREVAQPFSDDGSRLLDAAELMPLQDELRRKYKPAWEAEVAVVVGKLGHYRDVWRPAHLGTMYQATLYPTAAKMQAEFTWKLNVLPLNPDSKEIRMILGNAYVDQIQAEAETRMVEQLAARIAAPIRIMVKRLNDPDETFKNSLVKNVEDMAALIPALNLTGNPELAALQQQIEADLVKYSADVLRTSPRARSDTAQKAQAILTSLSDWLPADQQPPPPVPELALERSLLDPVPPRWDTVTVDLPDEPEPEPIAAAPPAPKVVAPPNWRDRLRSLKAA